MQNTPGQEKEKTARNGKAPDMACLTWEKDLCLHTPEPALTTARGGVHLCQNYKPPPTKDAGTDTLCINTSVLP